MRILVLEDDDRSGPLLRGHLINGGYVVDLVKTIADFHAAASVMDHDLYLIDLSLPDGEGIDLIKTLRSGTKRNIPIMITTGRASIPDRVAGLDCGADDYLVKPFHKDEVMARIRALRRRPAKMLDKQVRVGRLYLNTNTGEIFFDDKRVNMRPSERRLLALLIRKSGNVVPRNLIEDSLHGLEEAPTSNSIEKLVSRVRKNIKGENMGVELKTVRGAGYLLEETANPCERERQDLPARH